MKTTVTEEIKCGNCGNINRSLKLNDDTPWCCPKCKSWTVFREGKIVETEREEI